MFPSEADARAWDDATDVLCVCNYLMPWGCGEQQDTHPLHLLCSAQTSLARASLWRSLGLGHPLWAPGSGSLVCSVARVEKKPVSWHKDVCREESRHVKTQLLSSFIILHPRTCGQLDQVAEATRNREEVVEVMSHQLEVPRRRKHGLDLRL